MAALERQSQENMIIMCDKHEKLVAEFYCVKDDQYLCYKCALLDHKDHDIKDSKEVPYVEKAQALIDVNKMILDALKVKAGIINSN